MSLTFFRHFIASQFATLPKLTASFAGKTVIVTGSNTGLGFEAAKHYVTLNASKVILAVRSISKGEEAKTKIESATGRTGVVEVWQLDLSDNTSIQEFAKRAETLDRIDILLENAGVSNDRWTVNSESIEMTMQVNVYGTFLLMLLMIPILKKTGIKHNISPVITIVASEVHHFTKFGQKDLGGDILEFLNNKAKFDALDRYNISKLLEVVYIRELVNHLSSTNGVVVNIVNPGLNATELGRDVSLLAKIVMGTMILAIGRNPEVGGRAIVWPTTAGPESHGVYSLDLTFSDKAVSRWVRSDAGAKFGKEIYDGVNERLEKVSPGLVKSALSA